MFGKIFQLSAFTASVATADVTNHWAVIVSGSTGFGNYRHQADTCHAYQLLKNRGIPEEQIILLSYDDAAESRDNPFPGKLFNKPTATGTPGKDVYEGCKFAYRRHEVTPKKLLQVLTGDAENAKGPVLKSDENSEIFFYFADHGAPGLVAMPCGNLAPNCLWGGYLYADQLLDAFKTMKEKKMYKQMTVYMEACESGSMFTKLDKDLGIYAVSAANRSESSWATYCYPDDMIDGKHITACLGDLFSVNWLEDSDRSNMAMETLH